MKRKGVCVIILSVCASVAHSADTVTIGAPGKEDPVVLCGLPLVYDKNDDKTVAKAVGMLSGDLEHLTGVRPDVVSSAILPQRNAVIVGTVGQSALIDELVTTGKISVNDINDSSERFIIKSVNDNEGQNLLVIAGSDRRGTAYGVTTLSRELGVDPWVWWADVPVPYRPDVSVVADYVSKAPSVKYRGIFINDEDWGMRPWSSQGLDKDIDDIGPKTYAKVCELLLRLKGNMLAPAMHSCTGAFYSHPESKLVADTFGIIITTSHCEPMLFNNAAKSEWDSERDGKWDYGLNRDVIYGKFSDRLDEAADFENIYTIAMRGVHDEAMSRQRPLEEKIALLEEVIKDQRDMLSRKFGRPAEEIPQIFVPYKETLDLYRAGLRIPEDVTIVWPDDNYGYMKSLSSPEERIRSGGSGVYYHTSYLGTPHDYLWLCTTPPAMMYNELRKAYHTGADRYWLLNVGDIKPAELDTQTFFDMAWDFDSFDYSNVIRHQACAMSQWCGSEYEGTIQQILDEYYRLAWIRKPEFMGWELEWDEPAAKDIRPTDFSFSNYKDAIKRLADYNRVATKTQEIMSDLPDASRNPFFEMLGYPVLASEMMNRKFLFAQLNGELAAAGDKEGANFAARMSEEAADSIDFLTREYNSLENGKWKGMMAIAPGFVAKYQNRPVLTLYPEVGERIVGLSYDEELSYNNDSRDCRTLDLKNIKNASINPASTVRLIKGMGYDGYVLQLGEPGSDDIAEATLEIDSIAGDSIKLQIFHLPYFPLFEGQRCRIGVSLDDGEEQIIEFLPEEWSRTWKDNVLRNSALSEVILKVCEAASGKHTLRLRGIDSGMAIQRIVLDRGGFKPGYVGPDL